IAAAADYDRKSESLQVSIDDERVEPAEIAGPHGTRLHEVKSSGGHLRLDYQAVVDGQAELPTAEEIDLITYLRPSRYCESDTLGPTAASEFGGLRGVP